ncbi:hypothetical protein BCV72DRAFT_227898 [Rhizopus microsporus var. microsporus]|uniref:Uncharacterized protein n=2 Tax=Rhizopus microsporus TaxID=58291 RepID=A0A2G4T3T7_RHIZD|nr:uncharacterized protein RHIMIDRAFT_273189 [Rhizopus microsporus ATCC 52813]ORE06661.1 hypothetical protein BCV72DRAFT_227898 [Rhizopus microsporus var. microsporus]PHZ15674.1 hypothetical protein RHIMIDRAFT_273189 [Rhizopus microsporus ATCC 52813]
MARHLQNVFSGATLPTTRLTAPHIPQGPHPVTPDVCPITEYSTLCLVASFVST